MFVKHILTAVLTSTVLLSYGCQQGKEVASETEDVTSVEGEAMEFDQQVPTGDVSEEELTTFVGIVQKLQPLGMEAQQKMLAAVEDEGIDVQRFTEIMNAQQMPDSDADISKEEMDKYEKAQDAVDKIQDDVQAQMNEIIEDNGMSTDRYEEIMMVVQQDQALMQRVQQMMQPDMGEQQAPQGME